MKNKIVLFLLITGMLVNCCSCSNQNIDSISEQEQAVIIETIASKSIASLTESDIPTETAVSESVSETVTETEEVTTEEPTTEESIHTEEIASFFEDSGIDISEVQDSEQLIIVKSSGSDASVYLYELTENCWTKISHTYGVVGKNGVSAESREGDYRTPEGLFPLGFAFGTEDLENLSVEYRKMNSHCYWVDDPESEYYNQWVESDEIRWNSAEHLADYPTAYCYTVAINYNMNPVVPYAGSAIFLHCQTGSYTAGCVAVPKNDMYQILYWLDETKKPMILIY